MLKTKELDYCYNQLVVHICPIPITISNIYRHGGKN